MLAALNSAAYVVDDASRGPIATLRLPAPVPLLFHIWHSGGRDAKTPDLDDSPLSGAGRAKVFASYGGMVVVAAILFFLIRSLGEGLAAPTGPGPGAPLAAGQGVDTLFHALLALAVIVVTARMVGALFGLRKRPWVERASYPAK